MSVKKPRGLKVADEDWNRWQEEAKRRGTSVAALIHEAMDHELSGSTSGGVPALEGPALEGPESEKSTSGGAHVRWETYKKRREEEEAQRRSEVAMNPIDATPAVQEVQAQLEDDSFADDIFGVPSPSSPDRMTSHVEGPSGFEIEEPEPPELTKSEVAQWNKLQSMPVKERKGPHLRELAILQKKLNKRTAWLGRQSA